VSWKSFSLAFLLILSCTFLKAQTFINSRGFLVDGTLALVTVPVASAQSPTRVNNMGLLPDATGAIVVWPLGASNPATFTNSHGFVVNGTMAMIAVLAADVQQPTRANQSGILTDATGAVIISALSPSSNPATPITATLPPAFSSVKQGISFNSSPATNHPRRIMSTLKPRRTVRNGPE
jgi:hypothetical protein